MKITRMLHLLAQIAFWYVSISCSVSLLVMASMLWRSRAHCEGMPGPPAEALQDEEKET